MVSEDSNFLMNYVLPTIIDKIIRQERLMFLDAFILILSATLGA